MKTLSQSHCHRSPAPSSEREYTGELQRASDAECKRSARSRQDDYTQQSTPNSGFRNLTVAPPPRRPADDFRTLLVNPCVSLGAAQIPCARAPTWGPTPEGGRFSDADHTKQPFSRQSLCTRAARRAPTRCACRPAPCADLLRAPTRSVRRPAPCTDPAAPQADPTPAHYCAPAHRPNADPLLRARPLRAPAARQPLCTPDSTTRRSAPTSARRRALVPDLPTGRRTARSALRQQRRACFPGGGCVLRSSSVHLGHAQIVHACCGWQWEHTRAKETELCRLDARASSQRLTESWPNMCSTSTRIGDASVESMLADKLVQIIASEELRVSTHSADKRSACRVHHQHALS